MEQVGPSYLSACIAFDTSLGRHPRWLQEPWLSLSRPHRIWERRGAFSDEKAPAGVGGFPFSGRRLDKALTLRAIPATAVARPLRPRSGCWASLWRRSFASPPSDLQSPTKCEPLPRRRHPGGLSLHSDRRRRGIPSRWWYRQRHGPSRFHCNSYAMRWSPWPWSGESSFRWRSLVVECHGWRREVVPPPFPLSLGPIPDAMPSWWIVLAINRPPDSLLPALTLRHSDTGHPTMCLTWQGIPAVRRCILMLGRGRAGWWWQRRWKTRRLT